ncbi:hypothetical protein AQ490_23305 [Wenjunlia vitaminophila]|uniref:Lsr2 DNA-binding domain-containing protein n=1 Tax=Wenjunlia vitaminophila TaxID=76728 RepID=A0A0T6LSH5_WENVI|nr:histone-like nucleoid-structuring protein Lsr2 [Wenjunlia vitaminophila]KRV48799.1 hypothetical protein AQ490_23305 [Wenjunlia vitaminophila]
MTIAALLRLLQEDQPDVPRHPAPPLPRRHFTAKETPTVHTATQPTPAQPPAATPPSIPVGKLLAWGDAHPDPDVQDQAARARVALAGLRQRHAHDEELAALATEKEHLEERLAALRAREAELAPPRRRRRTADYDTAAVRAWAAGAGVHCPPRGRVPKTVVDAWRHATGTAPASA